MLVADAAAAPPALAFDVVDLYAAHDAWGFNCGPGSLCAVLGMTPEEIRPHLVGFEGTRHMTPSLMNAIVAKLRIPNRRAQGSGFASANIAWPNCGVARVQWDGPWMKAGVPPAARYVRTHYVGAWGAGDAQMIFDVNAGQGGAWITLAEWGCVLAPELAKFHKGATGSWWVTHAHQFDLTTWRKPASGDVLGKPRPPALYVGADSER